MNGNLPYTGRLVVSGRTGITVNTSGAKRMPWTIDKADDFGPQRTLGFAFGHADAMLWRAAPDMIDALKSCIEGLRNQGAHPQAQQARIKKALAAIAKAEDHAPNS